MQEFHLNPLRSGPHLLHDPSVQALLTNVVRSANIQPASGLSAQQFSVAWIILGQKNFLHVPPDKVRILSEAFVLI